MNKYPRLIAVAKTYRFQQLLKSVIKMPTVFFINKLSFKFKTLSLQYVRMIIIIVVVVVVSC